MATRSITVFHDEQDNPILAVYRHWDGYPEGHGLDLAGILRRFRYYSNGVPVEPLQEETLVANGMDNLAIVTVAELYNLLLEANKRPLPGVTKDLGTLTKLVSLYVMPLDGREWPWDIEWLYRVKVSEGKLVMEIHVAGPDRFHLVWSGAPSEFSESVAASIS